MEVGGNTPLSRCYTSQKSPVLVHVQNFGGQAVSLGGGVTVMEKREILAGWVTKVSLKCTNKAGVGRKGDI